MRRFRKGVLLHLHNMMVFCWWGRCFTQSAYLFALVKIIFCKLILHPWDIDTTNLRLRHDFATCANKSLSLVFYALCKSSNYAGGGKGAVNTDIRSDAFVRELNGTQEWVSFGSRRVVTSQWLRLGSAKWLITWRANFTWSGRKCGSRR